MGIAQLDGIPRVLVMISGVVGWRTVRPVNRLVEMPEPRGVDAGVIRGQRQRRGNGRQQRNQCATIGRFHSAIWTRIRYDNRRRWLPHEDAMPPIGILGSMGFDSVNKKAPEKSGAALALFLN